ncbi:hypothetical protein ALQ33_05404 [Pseudomonas syringae pv. philadelphi]|uniref:Uncharacterized protein n=2 Tax=Pseudomonas TaxID=286 RepID=A0A3M3YNH1_9PSED|nr:hypothetical protein ALQ33_05404 [Pseudomonas syringae pv. philadelphi]
MIGRLVVSDVRAAVFAVAQAVGVGVGEAVFGTVDADEFIVSLGVVHFFLEGGDVFRGYHAVFGTMLDQHRHFDARFGRGVGDQCAVEAGHAQQWFAATRCIQNNLATEAVTHRCNLFRVGLRLFLQLLKPGIKALVGCIAVLEGSLHEGHRVFRVLGVLAFTVHVDGHGAVTQCCQITGAALGVVVQPPPFVNHQHTGSRAFYCVVVGVVTHQFCAVGTFVVNLLGLDRRLGEPGQAHHDHCNPQTHVQLLLGWGAAWRSKDSGFCHMWRARLFSAGSCSVQSGFSPARLLLNRTLTASPSAKGVDMVNLNKFFLALAFLGGSAAAQAGDGKLDVARIEFAKTSEKPDDTHGWGHALGGQSQSSVAGGTLYSPPVYGSLTGTHNGLPVSREILLGSYDVTQHVPVSAHLLSTDATMSFHSLS